MTKTAETLDSLLRSRARAELEQRTRKAIDAALSSLGKYDSISLAHEGLHITDDAEGRATAEITTGGLKDVLVNAVLARAGLGIEQSAVLEFIDRVNQVGDDIDELRNQSE